jgi:Zn-dependent protease
MAAAAVDGLCVTACYPRIMTRGFLTVFEGKRLVVRLHWTVPLGAFVIGQFRFVPGFWLGFFFVILIHELGHAAMVRACGARVRNVDLHGAGGDCSWDGTVTPVQRALIAWGGVLAQLVLFGVVVAWLRVSPPHFELGFATDFLDACRTANLWLIAFNLIPARDLDGVEAWKLFPLLWRRRNERGARARGARRSAVDARRKAAAEIAKLDAAEKAGAADREVDDMVAKILERATSKKGERT